MRRIPFYLMAIVAISLVALACKSKKETTKTAETVSAVPKADLLTVATQKFPGITQADLDAGKLIFKNDCSKCHGTPAISERTEFEWTGAINRMAPRAKLTDDQKTKLLRYVLSERAAVN